MLVSNKIIYILLKLKMKMKIYYTVSINQLINFYSYNYIYLAK